MGHHKETFITKYIFSLDHKMIAKTVFVNWNVYGVSWNAYVGDI